MASSKLSPAEALALHFAEHREDSTKSSPSLIAQMEHRRALVSYWDIQPGSTVLEIGCGQGDTTIVLADAVGENGHVDAVDPGALDYGSPFTLAQTQAHIQSRPLGPRINFHTPASPLSHLAHLPPSPSPHYTHAVLAHSIFYFASPSILPALIAALKPHCGQICIAEWALTSASPRAFPHILTSLLRWALEVQRGVESEGNIRTVVSPRGIRGVVVGRGERGVEVVDEEEDGSRSRGGSGSPRFALTRERILSAPNGMRDAYWEVRDILQVSGAEMRLLRENGPSDSEAAAVETLFDAVALAAAGLEGGVQDVERMDVWVGVFDRV